MCVPPVFVCLSVCHTQCLWRYKTPSALDSISLHSFVQCSFTFPSYHRQLCRNLSRTISCNQSATQITRSPTYNEEAMGSTPGPSGSGQYQVVTTWMGDCLQTGKPFWHIPQPTTKVNSAFHPSVWVNPVPAGLAGVKVGHMHIRGQKTSFSGLYTLLSGPQISLCTSGSLLTAISSSKSLNPFSEHGYLNTIYSNNT